MNISDVKKQVTGASYEGDVDILENIYNRSGNNIMNGYLGDGISNISKDSDGNFQFESVHLSGDLVTKSIGTVLRDSVLIKQTQKDSNNCFSQLFSWKKDGSSYTYIGFSDEDSLNYAYNQIKDLYPKFLGNTLMDAIGLVNIPIDKVTNIKLSQNINSRKDVCNMINDFFNNICESSTIKADFII